MALLRFFIANNKHVSLMFLVFKVGACPGVWWCFIIYVAWLTDERGLLALFPAGPLPEILIITISETPLAGFELAQNLSSGLNEWSCAVVINTTSRRHIEINNRDSISVVFCYIGKMLFNWSCSQLTNEI